MSVTLQQLAESLARRLGRSVAIDDTRVRLLAYSPHLGEVDPARATSILRRAVPKNLVDHVYDSGAADADGLFTVAKRDDLGLEVARIGHSIVHQGRRLGFLWLLSSDGPVLPEQRDAVSRAAADAGLLMHREHLNAGSERERERALLGHLIGEDEELRASAVDDIVVEGLFAAGSFAVMVVELGGPDHQVTETDRLALATGLRVIRGQRQSQHIAAYERRDHLIVLSAESLGASARADLITLGWSLRDKVLALSDTEQCWVGIGRSQRDLEHARLSYEEARRTARVCQRVGNLDPVMTIESLGMFDLLSRVPEDALRAAVHPGLRELLKQRTASDGLVQTLEVFLANAGDVKSASQQLFVHRTSLYYRMRRIQEITGLDLSDGEHVLTAQVGLKIARLIDLI